MSDRIRNICIAAQVDAGKTTLTDALMLRAGLVSSRKSGDQRSTDTMQQEQERGITIKSMGVSVQFKEHTINVIDSPGHVDFSSEVTAAVRVTDGVVILIDVKDGVMVQTENVIRQAISEKVRPVLVINKCDRLFKELKLGPEEIYDKLCEDIAQVNAFLSQFSVPEIGDTTIDPLSGNVAFGSAYHGWMFRLDDMAAFWSSKLKKDVKETASLLWKKKKYFCKYVLEPIKMIYDHIEEGNFSAAAAILDKLGVPHTPIKPDDSPTAKEVTRSLLGAWMPAGPAVLDMVIDRLPSPVEAQPYRAQYLYPCGNQGGFEANVEGDEDQEAQEVGEGEDAENGRSDADIAILSENDEVLDSIRRCDPNGPFVMYVSKMFPDATYSRFYAYGRVFSGSVRPGQKITVVTADYDPLTKTPKPREVAAQQVVTVMAGKMEPVDKVEAGNICAIMGLDKAILKTATLLSSPRHFPVRDMKFMVAPVVRVAIAPKRDKDLATFKKGVRKLTMWDPLLEVYTDEATGETIVAGAGELQVEVSITQLQQEFCRGIEIVTKEPVVNYCETIAALLDTPVLSKSSNKHNRLYVKAAPLDAQMVAEIEDGDIVPNPRDQKLQARVLHEKYGVDRDLFGTKRLWGFGPTDRSGNVLVDGTTSVAYMNEAKGNVMPGFNTATLAGPLCGEPVRGVMFTITDAKLHSDSAHRGGDQLSPCTRRVVHSAIMHAGVRLVEPMFLARVSVPMEHAGPVFSILSLRRGEIIESITSTETNTQEIRAYLPVSESFGFDAQLKAETSGRALPQCSFSHWKVMEDDPLEEGSRTNKLARAIRERKKLSAALPQVQDYTERL